MRYFILEAGRGDGGRPRVIQLTREGEYGIRSVVHLAMCGQKRVVLARDIADAQDIPESFLRKILQKLVCKGLISSYRGAKGGFVLSKPPEQITLLEIIEAVEGPVLLNKCVLCLGECDRESFCPVHTVWVEAQRRLTDILGSTTVADVIASERGRASKRKTARAGQPKSPR